MNDVMTLSGRRGRSLIDECIDRERAAMGGFGPFERARMLERSPEKVRSLLLKAREHPGIVGVDSQFMGPEGQPSGAPASYAAVNTTNVETNLWVPGIWQPIPANSMQAGKFYRVDFGGILGTSSSAPTATFTPRVGQSATPASNVTLGATTAVTMIASLAAVPFNGWLIMQVRALANAASGASAVGGGQIVIGGLTTTAAVSMSMGGTVASTVDNTAATGLVVSITWGTNAAANTITAQYVTPVLSLN